GRDQISENVVGASLLLLDIKMLDYGKVDENESDEGAEVQQLDCGLEVHQQGPDQRCGGGDVNGAGGSSIPGRNVAEYRTGKNSVATHGVQQTRSSSLSGERAGNTRHQQHKCQDQEHDLPADT